MASFAVPSFDRFRSFLTRERGTRWGETLLVIVLAVALADFTWNLIPAPGGKMAVSPGTPVENGTAPSPSGKGGETGSFTVSTAVKELFGKTPDGGQTPGGRAEPVRETRLNLTLKGILAHREEGKKLALIAGGDEEEKVYAVGDSVPGGAEIVRIEPRRVILRRNGITESLKLQVTKLEGRSSGLAPGAGQGGTGGIRQVAKHRREVSPQTVQKQLDNLPQLLQQAKAVPYSRNGRKAGFRIVNIQQGSVFQELGLKEGDVIQGVNGKDIRTPSQALKAYRELKDASSFRVRLLREGQQVNMNYAVK
jgi:general secretion pathway protein C